MLIYNTPNIIMNSAYSYVKYRYFIQLREFDTWFCMEGPLSSLTKDNKRDTRESKSIYYIGLPGIYLI